MTPALRVGFLVSALLHVAVVAAFSLSTRPAVPVVAAQAPITLSLAVFQPPAPMIEARAAPVARPNPVSAEPVADAGQAVVESPRPPPAPPVAPRPRVAQPGPSAAVVQRPVAPSERRVVKRPRPAVAPERVAARQPVSAKVRVSPAVSAPTPAPAVGARAAPAQPVMNVQATQHYLAALAARIDRSKFYPRASRRLGEEGMAVVSFVIQRDGELTDIRIVESSGHQRLDDAALKTLRRVTPFQRIPDAIDREHWPITVPIRFSLRG